MTSLMLYKFRSINDWSLDTLRSGKMWFSLPDKLNDTFEFSIAIFSRLTPIELVEHFENRFKIDYVAPKLLDDMIKHGGSEGFPATEQYVKNFLNATSMENRTLFVITLIHYLREKSLTTQAIVDMLRLGEDSELRD